MKKKVELYIDNKEGQQGNVKKEINEKRHGNAVIRRNAKSHADDPFFLKKAEEAREALSKIVLPKAGEK